MSGVSGYGSDFLDVMPHTITVERLTGRSDDGSPVYAAAVTYPARIGTKQRNVIGADGQMKVARGSVWLPTGDAIDSDSRITLSTDGSHPIILASNTSADESGDAVTRLDFQ